MENLQLKATTIKDFDAKCYNVHRHRRKFCLKISESIFPNALCTNGCLQNGQDLSLMAHKNHRIYNILISICIWSTFSFSTVNINQWVRHNQTVATVSKMCSLYVDD